MNQTNLVFLELSFRTVLMIFSLYVDTNPLYKSKKSANFSKVVATSAVFSWFRNTFFLF